MLRRYLSRILNAYRKCFAKRGPGRAGKSFRHNRFAQLRVLYSDTGANPIAEVAAVANDGVKRGLFFGRARQLRELVDLVQRDEA